MAERNHSTAEEATEAAAGVGSARIPMGASPSAAPVAGTLVPKKSAKGDTTLGVKGNRQNIERIGATYRVGANFSQSIDPAAGATMANARIVPSVQGRANPNFESGIQGSSI